MKTSTFYKDSKGNKRIYSAIKDTAFHKMLRENNNGKTYQHEDNTPLFFTEGIPLDKPLYVTAVIT